MTSPRTLVLGSRGSDLARAQTRQVEEALRSAWPQLHVETKVIVTRGDESSGEAPAIVDRQAGRKGMFTREIERALLEKQIDLAVHSAKDLPSDAAAGLEVSAVLPRAAVEDIFISKQGGGVASLASGAVIATGSVRRQHQLRAEIEGLRLVDLRGNVPTRLRKLCASDWNGIVLARAGLERLGMTLLDGRFQFEETQLFVEPMVGDAFLPAGGQGVIALQIRADDDEARALVGAINHHETLMCLRAEREFLRLLQGDCDSPVGVLATLDGDAQMGLRAQVFETNALRPRTARIAGPLATHTPEAIAAGLMEKLYGG